MPVTKNVLIEHTLMFKMFKDDMHSYVATVYTYLVLIFRRFQIFVDFMAMVLLFMNITKVIYT